MLHCTVQKVHSSIVVQFALGMPGLPAKSGKKAASLLHALFSRVRALGVRKGIGQLLRSFEMYFSLHKCGESSLIQPRLIGIPRVVQHGSLSTQAIAAGNLPCEWLLANHGYNESPIDVTP